LVEIETGGKEAEHKTATSEMVYASRAPVGL